MWLRIFIALSAVAVAGCAAYFSVTGLGVLFSGASLSVMVMAGSLEFAKLIAASYLKQKWDSIGWMFKTYLTTAVVVLVCITSAGIFGYLSNAFQQQNLKLGQVEREVAVWQQKIDVTEKEIERYNKQLDGLVKIRESQEQNIRTSTERGQGVSRYRDMVKRSDEDISTISKKITDLNEKTSQYYEQINNIKTNNMEVEREVGGFRFVADVFGLDLNTVVKWFILLIVFVFDPLAIALVIAFNQLSAPKESKTPAPRKREETLYEVYGEAPTTTTSTTTTSTTAPIIASERDAEVFASAIENPPAPSEKLVEAAQEYVHALDAEKELKASPEGSILPIYLDGNDKPAGYDTDNDGLIDRYTSTSSIQMREHLSKKPYYAHPDFDWTDKSKWINDQNAVNYWLRYKRPSVENSDDNIKSY
jgi:cell division protein FtsB